MRKFAKPALAAILVIHFAILIQPTFADDPPEVAQIAQTAANAQNAAEYEVAIQKWEELISEYPQSSQIGVALYHSGFCHVQTGNFAKAADRLQQSISKLDPQASVSMAQAYLFLGFSQAKLGRELLSENSNASQEAQQWLTTSTQTFVTLLNRYPDFEDADQALFFQGDAFEALKRYNDAADSYSKMLQKENPEFKLDGLFALAFIRSQQGKYDQAYDLYSKFIAEGSSHESFNEVQFRAAKSLTELANSAKNRGDTERVSTLLNQAAAQFDKVYIAKDRNWSDDAKFEQANILNQLKKYDESARAYEAVVQIADSDLAEQARVYAGRDYLRSGDGNAAKQVLEKAIAVDSEYSAEAAHWLVQLYLRSQQNEQAYALADTWIEQSKDTAIKIALMLDKADAAYAIDKRRPESQELYLAITNDFPKHRLAPTALYNASYAAMETGEFDDAVKFTKRFRSEYSASDYMPDVLEVEADSFLLASKPELAESTFNDLIAEFSDHPKATLWQLRKGLSLYMQKKYDDTTALLSGIVQNLQAPEKKAEALHWVGSSHYQLGQSDKAIESLQESFATSKTWRRADETLLTLSRSFYAAKKADEAKQVTERLVQSFPKSPLIGEARYRLGEFEYDSGNFEQAIKNYTSVVEGSAKSQFAPYALYGIGWSQLQLSQFKQSVESFSRLIETFPKHSLATEVLVGRASANRQLSNLDQAIADANDYLKNDAAQTKKEEALYELGLAQMAKQDWKPATTTFEQLLTVAKDSELADRYHYELGWAYKTQKENSNAIKQFKQIVNNWPDSNLAAESNFHVAQKAYEDGDFDIAAKHFKACFETSKDQSIKEKAIYKLAWTQYKRKDFESALKSFRQQVSEFPKGQLHADGLFMVSESLYEADKFSEALQEYQVAKPIIETSKTVSKDKKILTFLHGAQSANLAKEHKLAIEFAESLLNSDVGFEIEKNIKRDAQMEIGDAYRGLGDQEKAVTAYTEASKHPGKTGARSMSMIGEIYFDQKNFAAAINKFKLVWFGYGGTASAENVKPWQAFAIYEAARCNLLQASESKNNPKLMNKFVDEAKKQFNYLIENFPNDKLIPRAKSQLESLGQ